MTDAAPPVIVPRLTTSRLHLRELQTGDFEAYARFMEDPVATRYLSGAIDRRAAWRLFASSTGLWMLTGSGWWAVELRATGEMVGFVGAFFRETTLHLGRDADLEVGWSVFPRFWRNGYATEAARAALAFGFERFDIRRAIAHLDPLNVGSAGVCKAIGMTYDAEVDFYGEPCARWAIDRDTHTAVRPMDATKT
jgi:RimJ/RimL family protein N-acetyltransferase